MQSTTINIDYGAVVFPSERLDEGVLPDHPRRPGATHFVAWKFGYRVFEPIFTAKIDPDSDIAPPDMELRISNQQWGAWYDILPDEVEDAYAIGGLLMGRHIEKVKARLKDRMFSRLHPKNRAEAERLCAFPSVSEARLLVTQIVTDGEKS